MIICWCFIWIQGKIVNYFDSQIKKNVENILKTGTWGQKNIAYVTCFRTWEVLPNMPQPRATLGCTLIKKNKVNYLAILGGKNSYGDLDDISFYDIDRGIWVTNKFTIKLPQPMSDIHGVIGSRMDIQGCDVMILLASRLYVCTGNYNWKWIDITGKINEYSRSVKVGANELLPCGTQ